MSVKSEVCAYILYSAGSYGPGAILSTENDNRRHRA